MHIKIIIKRVRPRDLQFLFYSSSHVFFKFALFTHRDAPIAGIQRLVIFSRGIYSEQLVVGIMARQGRRAQKCSPLIIGQSSADDLLYQGNCSKDEYGGRERTELPSSPVPSRPI